jgi:hypothetical protein
MGRIMSDKKKTLSRRTKRDIAVVTETRKFLLGFPDVSKGACVSLAGQIRKALQTT